MTHRAPFFDQVIDKSEFERRNTQQKESLHEQLYNPDVNQAPGLSENIMSRSMTKFVAGTSLPEKSEFATPSNDYVQTNRQPNPPTDGQEPFICDLTTSDAQYERYKNLMRSKFYNLQVNSTTMGGMQAEQAAKYQHPATFTNYTNVIQEQRQQMLNLLNNPTNAGPDILSSRLQEAKEEVRKPQLVQVYRAPENTVEVKRDAGYACHTLNNMVTQEVLDSLGGI